MTESPVLVTAQLPHLVPRDDRLHGPRGHHVHLALEHVDLRHDLAGRALDLDLDLGDARAFDLVPEALPDLFVGGQLVWLAIVLVQNGVLR